MQDNNSKILNLCLFELTLVCLEIEFVLSEKGKNPSGDTLVLLPSLSEDQDVIQVDYDNTLHN